MNTVNMLNLKTYNLPSSAKEKSTVRSIALNLVRLLTCTRPAGKRFHKEITRTEKKLARAFIRESR